MSYTNGLDNPELYFQAKLYTGNSGTNAITFDGSENMSPDLVWLKRRDSGSNNHRLCDSVRGVNKQLYSSSTGTEGTSSGVVQSFDSNGFTLNTSDSSVNVGSYVCWNWKKQAGIFDVVSYTGNGSGRTISHNLNSVPSFMIVKNRDAARSWNVYFGDPTDYIYLNDTAAAADYNEIWNDTAPTASVFSVGTDNGVNQSSEKYIAYLFGNKQGVSSAGTYVGNGSSSGAYIHLGFSASCFIVKRTDTTNDWQIHDNKRDTSNGVTQRLNPNLSSGESTTGAFYDFTSTGVKCRNTDFSMNASGGTYIYLAFAENPFVNSGGVPTTAR